ncbi:MAG: hypothetical protein JRF06_04675 [Deltaproteobacteria bacterium]|nr:hypothetical protein [Deltaproteobacteria bacterium]
MNFIKEHGIQKFIENQTKRINLLEKTIENFDDGRSRSFYCKVAALLDAKSIERSLDEAANKIKADNIQSNDIKNRARILKGLLNEAVVEEGVELK